MREPHVIFLSSTHRAKVRQLSRFTDADRARALTAAQTHLAAIPACQLTGTLKLGDRSQVFTGQYGTAPTVFKWFLTDDAAAIVTATQEELAEVTPRLSTGPLQINRCLAALPDLGVVVLSHAAGPRLTGVIADATPAERAQLMQQAGAWLAAYVGPRHRVGSFGPGYWLKRLQGRAIPPLDAGLLGALHNALSDMAADLHGVDVTQAASHGDFAAINLHYADGVMTGVDVQGTAWLPLARDVAKFLVWATIHCPAPGPTLCGVPRADLAAILAGHPIPLSEVETTLPFFIGTQLYGRLIENHRHATRGDITRQAILNFLDWRSQKDSNPQPAD